MDRRKYFEDMILPEEKRYIVRHETINGMLAFAVDSFADDPAVVDGDKTVTFAQLQSDAATVRGAIKDVPAGMNVGIYMKNDYAFIRAFIGTVTSGRTAVLFPVGMTADKVYGCCRKYKVGLMLREDEFAALMPDFVPSMGADAAGEPVPEAAVTAKTPAAIMFTGGTTGTPKGALLSHGALCLGAYNGCFTPAGVIKSRYVSLMPLTHVFGLVRNALTSIMTGSCLYMCPNMKDMVTVIMKARPTILVLVPALADLLFKLTKLHSPAILGGALKIIICGAAPVPPSLLAKYDSLGVMVAPGYGLTETANLVSGNGSTKDKPSSVGIPYPDQDIKLVDDEIWVKGPHLMECYYNDPAETAAAIEDGWLKTGDLGRFDEDGFLYITGRRKNIIVRQNGENVSPEELEAEADAFPFVAGSLVYEDKNEFGQQILVMELLPEPAALKAMVIADGAKAVNDAVEQINARNPEYKHIQKVIVRDKDFDRSPSMKIIRPSQRS